MHICWVGGHFDEEYTPAEYVRRPANASFSVIVVGASRWKTAAISAASRKPRPRTKTEPCSATTASSASRCLVAHLGASSVTSADSTGGLPGCRSTSRSGAGDEDNISAPFRWCWGRTRQSG